MEDSLPLSDTLGFETQTDILTLLENVKCQGNNPSALQQALSALATICSSSTQCQEYFQLAGGIEVLKEMILKGTCPVKVVHAVLYCLACAVKQNVPSQNLVLSENLLNVIHSLLSEKDIDYSISEKVLLAANFLLSCLIAGNSKGQNLALETKCLESLINLLRDCVTDECDDDSRFAAITRTLGICVNNPQNDKNQRACCSVLPIVLKFISANPHYHSVSHLLTLIGLVVANNTSNQNRIRNCGGIEVLVNLLKNQMFHLKTTEFPHKTIACSVGALDACIADNVDACKQASDLGLVPILIDLLGEIDVEESNLQIITLTIAHVLESSKDCCSLICDSQVYHLLLNHLANSQDEELFKTIKYILALCKTEELEKGKKAHEEGRMIPDEIKDISTLYTANLNSYKDLNDIVRQLSSLLPDVDHRNLTERNSDVHVDVYNQQYSFKTGSEQRPSTSRINPINEAGTVSRAIRDATQWAQLPGDINKKCLISETNRAKYSSPDVIGHKTRALYIKSPYRPKIAQAHNQTTEFSYKDRQADGNFLNKELHNSSDVRLGLNGNNYNRRINTDHVSYISTDHFSARNHFSPDSYRKMKRSVPGAHQEDDCALSSPYMRKFSGTERRAVDTKSNGRYPDLGLKGKRSSANDAPQYHNSSNQVVLDNVDYEHQFRADYSQTNGVSRKENMRQSPFCSPSQNITYNPRERRQQENEYGVTSDTMSRLDHRTVCEDSLLRNGHVCSNPEPKSPRLLLNARSDQYDNTRGRNVQLGHSENLPMSRTKFSHREPGNTNNETEVVGSNENPEKNSSAVNCFLHDIENHVSEANSFPNSEISSGNLLNVSLRKSMNQPQSVKPSCPADDQQTLQGGMLNPLLTDPLPMLSNLQKMINTFFLALIPAQLKESFTLLSATDASASSENKLKKDVNSSHIQQTTTSLSTQELQEKNVGLDGKEAISPCLNINNEPDDILSLCEDENTETFKGNINNFQHNRQNKTLPSSAIESSNDEHSNTLEQNFTNAGTKQQNMAISKKYIGNTLASQENRTSVTLENLKTKQSTNIDHEPVAKSVMSTPLVKDIHGVFIQPPHPALCSVAGNFRNFPNVRLAPAPPINKSTSTPLKQGDSHLEPPSPALSEFDTNLMKVAKTRQAVYLSSRLDTIRKPGSEASEGVISMSNTKSDANFIQKSTPLKEHTPPVVSISKILWQNTSIKNKIATSFSTPQVKLNVNKVSSAVPVKHPMGLASLRSKLFETMPAVPRQKNSLLDPKCPGCRTASELNSRTFNIAIETSVYTCDYHRTVREMERESIAKHRKSNGSDSAVEDSDDQTSNFSNHHLNSLNKNDDMQSTTVQDLDQSLDSDNSDNDVYSFTSESSEMVQHYEKLDEADSSPCIDFSLRSVKETLLKKSRSSILQNRRPRIPYTEQEILNLENGVAKMGTCWNQILCSYTFHPSRTAVDLKDKYKRLMALKNTIPKRKRSPKPFSMCEIRRLKRGVKTYGYNWKAILAGGRFVPGRTAADLRDKWRSLNKAT